MRELQGEGTPWLYSTLWGVGVEVGGAPTDGSGRSPRGSRHNSLKTEIKRMERIITSPEETWQPRNALRHLWAVLKCRSRQSFMLLRQEHETNKVHTRIKMGKEIFTKSSYVQVEVSKIPLPGTNRSVWGKSLN